MAGLAADTVAERLRDRDTQSATLAALESHAAPIPTAVSLAAAGSGRADGDGRRGGGARRVRPRRAAGGAAGG
jgi:hypothetical protein